MSMLRSPSRRSARRLHLIGVVVTVAVLGACVQPDDPDVGVQALSADIVFGATPAGPANTAPMAGPAEPFDDVGLFDDFEPPAPRTFQTPLRPPRPPEICPVAGVNDFAERSAPRNVTDERPEPGVYLWKRTGSQRTAGLDIDIAGYEDRVIRNVRNIAAADAGAFEYETVQKTLDGNVQTSLWRVRPNNQAQRNVNNNFPAVFQNVGDPDRGIALVSTTVKSPDGTTVSSFNPATPLLHVPLPIDPGLNFQTSAMDPVTLMVVALDGGIVGHTEVDACGEVLDGWKVTSTLTYIMGTSQQQVKFDYVVAPHLGGLIISEHIESPLTDPTLRVDFNIGTTDPSPLPAG